MICRWSPGQKEFENYHGINLIRVGYNINSKLSLPISQNPVWKKIIDKIIREIKPDIIMPREIMLAEACGKAGKKYDIPVIMDMAENYPAAMKDWKKYRKSVISKLIVHKLNIPEKVEKKSVKLMDGIITVCHEQNVRLSNQYNLNLDNIQVVHNTPEMDTFHNIKKKEIQDKLIFGHHGYTSAEKSLLKFLKGFVLAVDTNKDIFFQIAGDGESLDELKETAFKSLHSDRINFIGKYDFKDMPGIINEFDIGVIPYQYSDFNNTTIHNKIFDFFAMGKPVLVSETEPFNRLISETNAGITVNCENINEISKAILNIRNLDLDEMGNNGRKAFETKYNWDVDSENMMNFIKKFI
jgi:glycosyltransferase involved in cell wall biosynthesis